MRGSTFGQAAAVAKPQVHPLNRQNLDENGFIYGQKGVVSVHRLASGFDISDGNPIPEPAGKFL